MTTSRRRSSSTRPNNSDANGGSFASPRHHQTNTDASDGAILDDVPQYSLSSSSGLLGPLYGSGSSYPVLSSSNSPSRPRARSAVSDTVLTQVYTTPNTSYGPSTHTGPPPMYQPNQRLPQAGNTSGQYVPPPPPMSLPSQQHMMSIPPPPPRNIANQPLQHPSIMIPPPPGPPPSTIQSSWQGNWGRSYDARGFPLPPPNPPTNSQHQTYNPSQGYMSHQPPPLAIPPPHASEHQMSATYIPHGDSFGPGVGIPGFGRQEPSFNRGDSAEFSALSDSSRSTRTTLDTGLTTPLEDLGSFYFRPFPIAIPYYSVQQHSIARIP